MPDFAKLLDLTGPRALAVCIACIIIKIANANGFLNLSEIHSSAATVTDVTAIISSALALMWVMEVIVRSFRKRRAQLRQRRQIRDYLSALGPEEEDLLRSMLANNQQSISRRLDDPVVARLVQKGLLRQSGMGNVLAWPFTVPQVVWQEMQMHWPQDWIASIMDEQGD